MSNRNLFQEMNLEAPADLLHNISLRIQTYEKKRRIRQFGLHGFLGIIATISCIPIIQSVSAGLSQSGFYDYLSLLGSDWSYIWQHKATYLYSLADSVPITGTIVLLILLIILSNSLTYFIKNYKQSTYQHKLQTT